ncbi:secretion protein HlyD [Novosphingobium sp. Rr 2-17]|uniref:efflux RND transporter periplasmic adaptor subunit n=1 Tax=Novosphingobium sp. Rr 2-17 TaxID=555793 RepID=UPI000269A236|nr:efflux RND transporter periplasmic adaptor subunit [Novosphingobium sp. Rr 2-17]EIZ77858.1 secretion protein HlyD [Novosphingobium sp. Rr 2-17]
MIRHRLYRELRRATLIGALALAGCSSSEPAADATEEAASLTVRATVPQALTWPREIAASGAIRPWQEMVISAETGAYRVASLNADVGTWAGAGQVLATLARDSLEAQRAQLQASVAQAQANLNKASSDVERARQVGDSGALSAQQIESYRVTQQTSKASLESARAQLRGVEVQLSQTAVRAPDAGVVSSRSANLGQVVSAGTELFRMVRQGKVEWQAELDSRQLRLAKAGQTSRVTLPGGAVVTGTIRLVSPTLEGTTSRAIAYVQLPVGSPAQAGMYGSGVIEIGSERVMTLPETAVVLRDGKSFVYALNGNKVKETVVKAGMRRDNRVEVSGIAAGTRVVATSASFLSDGAVVRVQQDGAK